jgi:hypothetical protein
MRRRLGFVLVLASVWAIGAAETASALSCPAPSQADADRAFATASAAVVGQIEEIEPLGPKPPPGGLIGRFAAYRVRVLEVHKGRQALFPGDVIRVTGSDYGWFGDPPAPPDRPWALLLDRGAHGWATGAFTQCGIGVSVDQLRAYGAANPEPPDGYVLEPDEPRVWLYALRFGRVPKSVRPALRRGVAVRLKCSRDCSLLVRATLPARAARRYGLARRRVTVASLRLRLAAGKSRSARVRFTRRARRALARARRLELGVTIVVRAGGARTARELTVTLAGPT